MWTDEPNRVQFTSISSIKWIHIFLTYSLRFEEQTNIKHRYKKDLSTTFLEPNTKVFGIDLILLVWKTFFKYKYNLDDCGLIYQLGFNESLTIQSQGYPFSYKLNQYCTYLIQAEEKRKIKLTILDLDLEDNERHDLCIDYLELRYFNLGQPGPKCVKVLK